MYQSELVRNYPKVFTIMEGKFVINCGASLLELFKTYSEIIHYIDGDVISVLEKCIKQKILEKE